MAIDRWKLHEVFQRLGALLTEPTRLCVFGSAPAILQGQPARKTQDVDVWDPKSSYDMGALAHACSLLGVLYDPLGEVEPNATYLQIVRPGIVSLPGGFTTEPIARYANLTVVMPPPAVLSAAKLVRGHDRDIEDVRWWMRHRNLEMPQIKRAIETLPGSRHREAALENLVLLRC